METLSRSLTLSSTEKEIQDENTLIEIESNVSSVIETHPKSSSFGSLIYWPKDSKDKAGPTFEGELPGSDHEDEQNSRTKKKGRRFSLFSKKKKEISVPKGKKSFIEEQNVQ